MISFIRVILFGFLGFLMDLCGLTITDWQFWAVMGDVVIISLLSYAEGLSE